MPETVATQSTRFSWFQRQIVCAVRVSVSNTYVKIMGYPYTQGQGRKVALNPVCPPALLIQCRRSAVLLALGGSFFFLYSPFLAGK